MPANARIRRLISYTSTAPRPPARSSHASGKDGDCQDEHLFNPPHTDTLSQIQRDIIASSLCRSSASTWMLYTACSLNPNSAKCCMRPRKKNSTSPAQEVSWHGTMHAPRVQIQRNQTTANTVQKNARTHTRTDSAGIKPESSVHWFPIHWFRETRKLPVLFRIFRNF